MSSKPVVMAVALGLALSGCSVRKLAVNSLANTLAEGGETFASDDDPELVRDAIPFALKTYEMLLAERPNHRRLLVATAKGFSQYAYGFLVRDAERLEERDLARALAIRRRARKLLLRGRDYALRALELVRPGLTAELEVGRLDGIAGIGVAEVEALYWAGASWGGAIAVIKDDADLLGDLPVVEAMMRRVIALDETVEWGGAHELMIVLEAGLAGGSLERAREHYERAVELTEGRSASVFVTFAENVLVREQDRAGFERTLGRALAIDPDAVPSWRLANVLAVERARWLLGRADELFVE